MIPLFKPYMPELPEINQILHLGSLSYGEYTRQFEKKLKLFFNTEYLIVTSSFTDAISVALKTLGLQYGDEVIISPMSCLASTQSYLSNGMRIKWADVDPGRGTLLPESVEKQITSDTKAIVHNHFCGYPGYIDEINKIGEKHGVFVINDGIECFGSEYKHRKIGNCGTDVTVFSLTAVRIPNCIDGGIVIFKDKSHYEKSILIRDCGIDRNNFRDEIGEINPLCDIELIGYSATMNNVNGYIGSKQMDKVESLLNRHRAQASKWMELFRNQNIYSPVYCEDSNPNYWVFGILTEKKRDTILKFRNLGYYASGVHINNDIYTVFGKADSFPGVKEFYSRFVALPCGWWMNEDN